MTGEARAYRMYARGRRVPHTHVFLVPTYQEDIPDRFFNAIVGFKKLPEQVAHS